MTNTDTDIPLAGALTTVTTGISALSGDKDARKPYLDGPISIESTFDDSKNDFKQWTKDIFEASVDSDRPLPGDTTRCLLFHRYRGGITQGTPPLLLVSLLCFIFAYYKPPTVAPDH